MAIPTHFALLAVAPGLAALRLLLLAVAAALTTHSVAPASGDDVGGPRSLGAGNRGEHPNGGAHSAKSSSRAP